MIQAIIYNLQRGVKLINAIDDSQYGDNSIAPYYSSIGIHMRHILDVFDCIFDGLETKKVDLSARKRNELAEKKVVFGLQYFEEVIEKLESLKSADLDVKVEVRDDLGLGMITANYTLASALIQAHRCHSSFCKYRIYYFSTGYSFTGC